MDILYSISLFAHYNYILVLFIGDAIFVLLNLKRRDFRYKLMLLTVSFAISFLLTDLAKGFYKVERPCQLIAGKVECPKTYGFPSLHASTSIVFPLVALGTNSFIIFYLAAIFIAVSRIYLGVHTLDQVVGGLCVGIVSYFIGIYVVGRIKHYFRGVFVE